MFPNDLLTNLGTNLTFIVDPQKICDYPETFLGAKPTQISLLFFDVGEI